MIRMNKHEMNVFALEIGENGIEFQDEIQLSGISSAALQFRTRAFLLMTIRICIQHSYESMSSCKLKFYHNFYLEFKQQSFSYRFNVN